MNGSLRSGASAQPQSGFRSHTCPLGARLSRAAVIAAAALLVSASAGFGAYYAGSLGAEHGAFLAALSVAMALGLELAKPFGVAAAFEALRVCRLAEGAALTLLAFVTIAYSLSAELSLMATMRSDRAADRAAASDAAHYARDRYTRAKAELDELTAGRPASELQALIDGVLADVRAGNCVALDGPFTREHCPRVVEWKAEQARSVRRTALETIMREVDEAGTAPTKTADPGAAALATFLAMAGLNVEPRELMEILILVAVLALEVGSALAIVLVRTSSPEAASVISSCMAPPMVQVVQRELIDDLPTREKVEAAILNQLAERGGSVNGTERGLAALLGASKPTVRRAICSLAAKGLVIAEASRNGTLLRLAT